MKKLTAGIFAGILTIVTVNAARADIATTNYVQGAIGSLEVAEKTGSGVIKNISQANGKINATLGTITNDDIATDAKIATTKIDGLDDALSAKQVKADIVVLDGENKVPAADADSDKKYPSMQVAKAIAAAAAAEVSSDLSDLTETVEENTTAIQTLNGDNMTEGSVKKAVKDAIDGLDAEEVTGVITKISQENGVLKATAGKVAKDNLDTALTAEIAAKMTTEEYNEATTMTADGEYAKKDKSVAENLTALDGQVKTDAAAIAILNGNDTTEGSVAYQIKGKVNTNTDLNKKVLTTNETTGQLMDASAGLSREGCDGVEGVTCILVNDAAGFRWEKVVNEYTASQSQE